MRFVIPQFFTVVVAADDVDGHDVNLLLQLN